MKTLLVIMTFAALSAPMRALAADVERNQAAWSTKMRGLEKTLSEILIDVSSNERFNSPKNFSRIEGNAEKLSKLAHELKGKNVSSPDADPSLQILANEFAKEADYASRVLVSGNRAYARNVLRSMTNYCMACHTRSTSGPRFQDMELSPQIKALNSLERANYLASTRHFDQALNEYEKIVSEPGNADHRPFDWEQAVRSSLVLSVRVKKDRDRAQSIVDRVLSEPKAPYFMKEQAAQWKESLAAWKGEASSKPQTEEGYYAQAIRLIAEAKAMQKYPADRSGDILYLRASSAVHDLMSFAPNGAYATDALYLAGLSYEALNGLNLWDLHEFYFLACILKSPHTDKARQCYKHYEESVYLGYTGSGGTNLPGTVVKKLRELDLMSDPTISPSTGAGALR